MARKHTESELLGFIDLYLSGVSYQNLVDQYTLKLADSTFFGPLKVEMFYLDTFDPPKYLD